MAGLFDINKLVKQAVKQQQKAKKDFEKMLKLQLKNVDKLAKPALAPVKKIQKNVLRDVNKLLNIAKQRQEENQKILSELKTIKSMIRAQSRMKKLVTKPIKRKPKIKK